MAWPSGAVSTVNLDATTDDPELAVVQIKEALDKLNQIIAHVSTFGQSLIDDADATAGRVTLGLGTLATQSGTFSGTSSGTNTGDQTTISGNAGSATVLQTARNINGVSFNGSLDITVAAAAGTLTGSTLAAGVTVSSIKILGSEVFIGDTSNANTATNGGLTVRSGGNVELFALKNSNVAHGMTTETETDTFAVFKCNNQWDFGLDGLGIKGLSEHTTGLALSAFVTSELTGKTAAAEGAIVLQCGTKSGTTWAAMGANANMVCFKNSDSNKFILDSDGDSHQDVGTAWTNFDYLDDVAALDALAYNVASPDDPIRRKFGEFLIEKRAELESHKLVTFNEDGHHFVNMSKLTMLNTGAIRQISERLKEVEQKLLA